VLLKLGVDVYHKRHKVPNVVLEAVVAHKSHWAFIEFLMCMIAAVAIVLFRGTNLLRLGPQLPECICDDTNDDAREHEGHDQVERDREKIVLRIDQRGVVEDWTLAKGVQMVQIALKEGSIVLFASRVVSGKLYIPRYST